MSTKTFTTIDIENKTYDGKKQINSNYYPCEYPCNLQLIETSACVWVSTLLWNVYYQGVDNPFGPTRTFLHNEFSFE